MSPTFTWHRGIHTYSHYITCTHTYLTYSHDIGAHIDMITHLDMMYLSTHPHLHTYISTPLTLSTFTLHACIDTFSQNVTYMHTHEIDLTWYEPHLNLIYISQKALSTLFRASRECFLSRLFGALFRALFGALFRASLTVLQRNLLVFAAWCTELLCVARYIQTSHKLDMTLKPHTN